MAALTVQNIDRNGLRYDNLGTGVSASDTFANDGRTVLFVENADAALTNVTFTRTPDLYASEPTQSTTPDNIVVAAGQDFLIGPFPPGAFGSTVTVAFSNQTSITATPLRLTSG